MLYSDVYKCNMVYAQFIKVNDSKIKVGGVAVMQWVND